MKSLLVALALFCVSACSTDPTAVKATVPGHVAVTLRHPGGEVSIVKTRVTLTRTSGAVAADVTANGPSVTADLTLDIDVDLAIGFQVTGEPMSMRVNYLNAASAAV